MTSDADLRASLVDLITMWEGQAETYPDTEAGRHAAAAVRGCADELREALAENGTTLVDADAHEEIREQFGDPPDFGELSKGLEWSFEPDFEVSLPDDADELQTAFDGLVCEQAERMERELRGAWRAGYDHVHVYDEVDDAMLGRDTPDMALSLTRAVLPGYEGDPRPDPPGYAYRFTYDLTSVPDDVIRRAIRGEVDA